MCIYIFGWQITRTNNERNHQQGIQITYAFIQVSKTEAGNKGSNKDNRRDGDHAGNK